ncbi:hypothetical protein [Roseomonas populi]|uniref:Uncharacterized protein n=1 Tax=Roseomonas populi TaxID=3121582 RepID=A0ABT1WXQ9_9PROT|nr:hypothetical protein [Roseomonas pecuniae]MCR0980623.1 hypothetical protein [Roseomonas pecuniae]
MAVHAHITPGALPRRVLADQAHDPRRRPLPFAAAVMTAELRAAIEQKAQQLMDEARAALDGAAYLIDFLDAADRPILDMEPDADGEASDDVGEEEHQEPWDAPITLAPDITHARVIRPTRRQMAAAYRRVGAPVPANLRGLFGRAWA